MRHNDYRALLLDELKQRQESRPEFSMNAFAKFVGLTSSHFNDIIKKRRGLSLAKAKYISQKLGLVSHEEELFLTSVKAEHSRSESERKLALKKLTILRSQETTILKLDLFALVSQWQHFAILELSRLNEFKCDETWIANKLGLEVTTARESLKRLISLKLLQEKNGKWSAHKGLLKTSDDIPSAAIKAHHTQVLNLAKNAIHTQTVEQREIYSLMLAINKGKILQAKKMIRKFQAEASALLSKPGEKRNAIYCMAIQFFEVTKNQD